MENEPEPKSEEGQLADIVERLDLVIQTGDYCPFVVDSIQKFIDPLWEGDPETTDKNW